MKSSQKAIRGLTRCESGAAAIEFAIIGLVMIVVCLAIVEFGRGLHLRNQISHAADKAARIILVNADTDLEKVVRDAWHGPNPELLEVTFGSESVDGVAFRTIAVRYPFSPLIPGLGPDTISLSLARRVPAGT